jgi:hypothetical protein
VRCKAWFGRRALDIPMRRYSNSHAFPRARLESPNVRHDRRPEASEAAGGRPLDGEGLGHILEGRTGAFDSN